MWYFAGILGIGVVLALGFVNAMWLESSADFESNR